MRNGIAHRYETRKLCISEKRLEIGISWKKKPHLSFSRNRKVISLNIQTLAQQAYHMLDAYEQELVPKAGFDLGPFNVDAILTRYFT